MSLFRVLYYILYCVCVQRVTSRAARAQALAAPSACRVHSTVSSYCRDPVWIRVHPDTTLWEGTAWVCTPGLRVALYGGIPSGTA